MNGMYYIKKCMKRRILIDCTCINSKMDGLSQYAINIIKCLSKQYSDINQYYILLRNKEYVRLFDSCKDNLKFKILNVPSIGFFRDLKLSLYLYITKRSYDIVYFISNQYPIFFNGGIYTIHDVIYESFPEQLGRLAWLKRLYLHFDVKWGIWFSDSIITVSNFTKQDVIKYHHLPKKVQQKMNVVYEGWEHMKINITSDEIELPFNKYLFYVGSSRGHKNLTRLLQAYLNIVDCLPSEWGFVIVGKMNRLSQSDISIINKLNKGRERVYLTGWISDEQLALLFKKAEAFIFPSLSEGFGIPILEAFYWRVPVLCSNNTVFPEVARDGALYFNPLDIGDIANCICDYVNQHSHYRKILTTKGSKILSNYSWVKSANKIFDIINSI